MAEYDEKFEQAISSALTEHLEQGIPGDVDVWGRVSERLGESENPSLKGNKAESASRWRTVSEFVLGSGPSGNESSRGNRSVSRLAFATGAIGLLLLTTVTAITIGRLAQRDQGISPAPTVTTSRAIPTSAAGWNVLASSDFTDIMPLLIGNSPDGERIKPFGAIAVGEDGNLWVAEGNILFEFRPEGSAPIQMITIDPNVPIGTNFIDGFDNVLVRGQNVWGCKGNTIYKMAMNGTLVQTYQPSVPQVPVIAIPLPPPEPVGLVADENGQILIEESDGHYLKADQDVSTNAGAQPTPFPGYPFGGKFYTYGSSQNEIMAGNVPVTIDVPGTIVDKHFLRVLPDGSFFVLVDAIAHTLPDVVDGAYTYVMHYDAGGKLTERARLYSPAGAAPSIGQVAMGPNNEVYAEYAALEDIGRVDVVRLIFRPASEPLPAVPTAQPTPIIPTPVPTIEMPQLPSPIPSTAAQAPTAESTPPGEPTTEVVDVPGAKGISVRLIHQVQAATTGVNTGNCGTEMTWVLQIKNSGTNSFQADIDKSSLAMTDSTGKSYPLSQACGGLPYSGSFAQATTINNGDNLQGYIAFQAEDIPSSVHYLTLRFTLSGTHVILQYDLPRQPPPLPSKTPTSGAQAHNPNS